MLPLQISQASGVPFYRQLHDQLAALIRSGALVEGDQLPSVRELARDLLVSLITVRRAYADLESAGFIQRRRGQGTFVHTGRDKDDPDKAQRQALQEARDTLTAAVQQARRLGLDDTEQRTHLDTIWSNGDTQ
ncbi:MAG: GntR family transcriptional regulator [Oligoflexia bacterium]|nr:GntR family transcriptional regulator [Oligoflexia bacterium]